MVTSTPGEAIHDAAHFGHVRALAQLVERRAQPWLGDVFPRAFGPEKRGDERDGTTKNDAKKMGFYDYVYILHIYIYRSI